MRDRSSSVSLSCLLQCIVTGVQQEHGDLVLLAKLFLRKGAKVEEQHRRPSSIFELYRIGTQPSTVV